MYHYPEACTTGARDLHRVAHMAPPSAVSDQVFPAVPPPAAAPSRGRGVTLAFLGLALYLWVIHSYRVPLGTTAIAIGLVGVLLGGASIRLPRSLALFGGFILWAAVTAPLARDFGLTIDALEVFVKLWLIGLVASNVANSRRELYLLVVVWLGFFALYPVRGTFFNFFSGVTHFGRYAWNFTFANPNDLAALTLPMLAMAVMVLQAERTSRWVRWSALAGVILLPLLIVITQSRGGIIALATMALLILAQYRRQARGLAIGVLVAGVVAIAAPPEAWERLSGLSEARTDLGAVDEEGSADQRFEIWRVAVAMAADRPLTGVGLGNYAEAHAEYAQSSQFRQTARGRRDTHSIYLNALAETGVLGLVLLLGVLISALGSALRTARRVASTDLAAARQLRTLAIGLVAIMQAGIFGTLHSVAFLYLYLGVLTSATVILGQVGGAPVPAQPRPLQVGVTGWRASQSSLRLGAGALSGSQRSRR